MISVAEGTDRTREGVNPTRFPSLQTEVHAGSLVPCPAVWGACDTPASADERGQLRPKLRPVLPPLRFPLLLAKSAKEPRGASLL